MAGSDEDGELGPWAGADLLTTAKVGVGIGADEGLPSGIRFRSNVAKLVRRRLATDKAKPDPKRNAIFLLQPSPPPAADNVKPKRVPMLDNGQEPLTARIWFVGANPASGHFVRYKAMDDDALFTMITDDLGMPDTPAIIFDPRLPEATIRYYPEGLHDPTICEFVPLTTVNITFDEVVKAVESTYNEKMITPDAQPTAGKLWKKDSKWWPQKNAEALVQMYLEIGLNSAFPTCTIRSEQPLPEGRLDIEIIENDALDRSIITQHGILELKVLRTFTENGKPPRNNRSWIKSGVEQAASYREGKGAKWGALLCFDMCKLDIGESDCFSHVKPLSKKLRVHLKRWYLYAKSSRLRAVRAAEKC